MPFVMRVDGMAPSSANRALRIRQFTEYFDRHRVIVHFRIEKFVMPKARKHAECFVGKDSFATFAEHIFAHVNVLDFNTLSYEKYVENARVNH